MKSTATNLVLAAVALVIWVVIAFGARPESGLVHIPLGAAVVLVARAIVLSGQEEKK